MFNIAGSNHVFSADKWFRFIIIIIIIYTYYLYIIYT